MWYREYTKKIDQYGRENNNDRILKKIYRFCNWDNNLDRILKNVEIVRVLSLFKRVSVPWVAVGVVGAVWKAVVFPADSSTFPF